VLYHKEKVLRLFLLFILLVSTSANASNLDIKIDEGILGAKWLDSEEAVIAAIGKPNGRFQINKNRTLLIYGKSLTLLISRGQLREVKIADVFSFEYDKMPLTINTEYSKNNFTINGEPFIEEEFEQVQKALGMNIGEPDYTKVVGTDDITITLGFSTTGMGGGGPFSLRYATFTYQL